MPLHKNHAGTPSPVFDAGLTNFRHLSLIVVSASIAMTLVQALTAPVVLSETFCRPVQFG